MGRNRRGRSPSTTLYDDAIYRINALEANVVRAMCPVEDLKPEDFLEWLLPPDVLAKLRAAWPHVQNKTGSDTSNITRDLDFACGKVCFSIDYGALKCLVPDDKLVVPHYVNTRMVEYVESIGEIAKQYEKLRQIVWHFSRNTITPGAAKHYWPTLQPLLPEDHPFHKVTGDRYRAHALPYTIAENLREAPEIVAKGLLCGGIVMPRSANSPVNIQVGLGQFHSLFPDTVK
jgi:hypothetical protein